LRKARIEPARPENRRNFVKASWLFDPAQTDSRLRIGLIDASFAVILLLPGGKQRTSRLFPRADPQTSQGFQGELGSAACFFAANNSENSGGAPGFPMGAAAYRSC
jgi:hypothetical protein